MIRTKLGDYIGDIIDVVQGEPIKGIDGAVYPDYIVVNEPYKNTFLKYRICTHDILAYK